MSLELAAMAMPITAQLGEMGAYFASDAFKETIETSTRAYWTGLSWLTAYAAVAIFISSTDDAFLDLYYWVLTGQRVLTQPFRYVPSTKKLHEMPQKKFAVMVPAWQESDVIVRMLMNTLSTMDYARFDIYVGVYPNDPATIAEVDAVVKREPRVFKATVGHDGPTSKADCLNWIIAEIGRQEIASGEEYDAILMQDSEDVIHPMSFKVVNAWLDRADMIQLPVLSMPRKWNALVACHYMDEFAEWHGKDLIARSHMTDLVPSAGVATAFSRRSIAMLCEERDNLPFNTDSLTEDYDIGHRFYEAGLKSAFVRYWAKMPVSEREAVFGNHTVTKYRRELVATREFFPDKASISIRQKSRWMLGISFMGWKQLGWIGPAAHRYFLYRDRKAIWTAPTGMLAYAIVFQSALYWGIATAVPSLGGLPPLIDPESWLWGIVLINFVFLVNRVVHRLIFTGAQHGLKYAVLAPVRMIVANYIGFMAAWRATRRYLWHMISGVKLTWDKTAHAYPSLAEINGTAEQKTRLGEALIFWGALNQDTLDAALDAQAQRYRPLGLLLLDRGDITDEHLANGFSEHTGLPAIALDPLKTPAETLERLPRDLARRYQAMAYGRENGAVHVAIGEPLKPEDAAALERAIGKPVKLAFAPMSDITFGLAHAYDRSQVEKEARTARILARLNLIAPEEDTEIWKAIRRPSVRFADLLVRRGAISHDNLRTAQDRLGAASDEQLGHDLIEAGLIDQADHDAAMLAASRPPAGYIRTARRLGYLKDHDIEVLAERHAELLEDA
ncbi:glycosyl transferase family protein [Hyphobacterium marinum]|uniref:Glycosyl transferase family protein n=1 Tax=Hyphobacterium marinum TaxID=3116574 RepID=A0ABU7LZV8_9PROT|nr:glycosyl transferase family protein [Hyphobacterium sp. Y6023]MEE2567094.1 glycosyl transferase family protein [Hyphobacterium sp. Y6023]